MKLSGRKRSPRGPERTVHSSRLKIDKDSARNVLVRTDLVVVHRDPLELHAIVPFVETIPLDSMLIRNHLPEFGTYAQKR